MRVLGSNILIKPKKKEQKIIVSSEPELTNYATVVSVGDRVSEIKEGDEIFWSARAGTPFEKDGEDFVLIDITSVFVVLD